MTRFCAFKHRSSECFAGVVRHRRNIKSANGGLSRDFHIHLAIQGDPAGKAAVAAGRNVRETMVQRLPANPARPHKGPQAFR